MPRTSNTTSLKSALASNSRIDHSKKKKAAHQTQAVQTAVRKSNRQRDRTYWLERGDRIMGFRTAGRATASKGKGKASTRRSYLDEDVEEEEEAEERDPTVSPISSLRTTEGKRAAATIVNEHSGNTDHDDSASDMTYDDEHVAQEEEHGSATAFGNSDDDLDLNGDGDLDGDDTWHAREASVPVNRTKLPQRSRKPKAAIQFKQQATGINITPRRPLRPLASRRRDEPAHSPPPSSSSSMSEGQVDDFFEHPLAKIKQQYGSSRVKQWQRAYGSQNRIRYFALDQIERDVFDCAGTATMCVLFRDNDGELAWQPSLEMKEKVRESLQKAQPMFPKALWPLIWRDSAAVDWILENVIREFDRRETKLLLPHITKLVPVFNEDLDEEELKVKVKFLSGDGQYPFVWAQYTEADENGAQRKHGQFRISAIVDAVRIVFFANKNGWGHTFGRVTSGMVAFTCVLMRIAMRRRAGVEANYRHEEHEVHFMNLFRQFRSKLPQLDQSSSKGSYLSELFQYASDAEESKDESNNKHCYREDSCEP